VDRNIVEVYNQQTLADFSPMFHGKHLDLKLVYPTYI